MRIVIVVLVVLAAACEKSNPNACCDTDPQCAALGVSKPLPCKDGQTCGPGFTCVAAECASSGDCMDPALPVCIDKLCVAKCTVDDDCMGAAGTPFCASDGTCVGCTSDTQCSGDKPFCDAQDHSCRGCIEDSECASGVCIDATATCAAANSIVYVSSVGTDAGNCTSSAPCATIAFAVGRLVGQANVVHIVGGILLPQPTVVVNHVIVIDGSDTTLRMPTTGPIVSISVTNTSAQLTLERVVLEGDPADTTPTVTVANAAGVLLARSKVHHGDLRTTGGSISVLDTALESSVVGCSGGSVDVERSSFAQTESGGIKSMNCQTTVLRNRFDPAFDGMLDATGGLLTAENNVFVVPSEFADVITLAANVSGSTLAFNTIVNTSAVLDTPIAIHCDASQNITSNIIAYNSSMPIYGCTTRHSLFDLAAGAAAQGNLMGDKATFFRDFATKDFHLATGSPALGAGEGGIVTSDIDGASRPQPAGANPDIGAYEAP